MPGCAAFNCKNREGPFYRFPQGKRNNTRLKAWLHNVGRIAFKHDTAKLCSRHFTNEQFEANRADGKRKLKPNAIPTLFSHRPEKSTRKPLTNRQMSSSPVEENNGMNLGKQHTSFQQLTHNKEYALCKGERKCLMYLADNLFSTLFKC